MKKLQECGKMRRSSFRILIMSIVCLVVVSGVLLLTNFNSTAEGPYTKSMPPIYFYNGIIFGNWEAYQADNEGPVAVGGDYAEIGTSKTHGFDVGAAYNGQYPTSQIGAYYNPNGYPSLLLNVNELSIGAPRGQQPAASWYYYGVYGGPIVMPQTLYNSYMSNSWPNSQKFNGGGDWSPTNIHYMDQGDLDEWFSDAYKASVAAGKQYLAANDVKLTAEEFINGRYLSQNANVYKNKYMTDREGNLVEDILVITVETPSNLQFSSNTALVASSEWARGYDMVIINFPDAITVSTGSDAGGFYINQLPNNIAWGRVANQPPSVLRSLGGENLLKAVNAVGENYVYSFPNATSIELTSTQVYGSVIAPNADFSGYGSSLNGQLICNNFIQGGGFELHAYGLNWRYFEDSDPDYEEDGGYDVEINKFLYYGWERDVPVADATFELWMEGQGADEIQGENATYIPYLDGDATYQFITDAYGQHTIRDVPSGKYMLIETEAPQHGKLNDTDPSLKATYYKYEFVVPKEGETPADQDYYTFDKNKVFIDRYNEAEVYPIEIRKKNKQDELLEGAIFSVYREKDSYFPDRTRVVVEEQTNANGSISAYMPFGEYSIVEIQAPKGYERLESPITFAIDANGDVVDLEDERNDNQGNASMSWVEWEDSLQVIYIVDEAGEPENTVTIYKVEEDENGRHVTMLPGAKFDLYRYDEEDDVWDVTKDNGSGNPHPQNWEYIESDLNGQFVLYNMPTGKYRLVEREAPSGYVVSNTITDGDMTYAAEFEVPKELDPFENESELDLLDNLIDENQEHVPESESEEESLDAGETEEETLSETDERGEDEEHQVEVQNGEFETPDAAAASVVVDVTAESEQKETELKQKPEKETEAGQSSEGGPAEQDEEPEDGEAPSDEADTEDIENRILSPMLAPVDELDGKNISVTITNQRLLTGLRLMKTSTAGEVKVSDARFILYKVNEAGGYREMGDAFTDEDGIIEVPRLSPGQYILREIRALEGHKRIEEDMGFTLDIDGNGNVDITLDSIAEKYIELERNGPDDRCTYTFKVKNEAYLANLLVYKRDIKVMQEGQEPNFTYVYTYLEGAVFEIQRKNEAGIYEKYDVMEPTRHETPGGDSTHPAYSEYENLPIGEYRLKEITFPDDYGPVTSSGVAYTFVITEKDAENGVTITFTVENTKSVAKDEVRVKKVDREDGTGLANVEFRLWELGGLADKWEADVSLAQIASDYNSGEMTMAKYAAGSQFVTDADGYLYLENMEAGTYGLAEIVPPDDYLFVLDARSTLAGSSFSMDYYYQITIFRVEEIEPDNSEGGVRIAWVHEPKLEQDEARFRNDLHNVETKNWPRDQYPKYGEEDAYLEFTITNRKLKIPELEFKKVDEDTGEPLAGAKFALYTTPNDYNEKEDYNDPEKYQSGIPLDNLVDTFVSGSDGTVTIIIPEEFKQKRDGSQNVFGRFKLVEIEAPFGYEISSEPFYFSLEVNQDTKAVDIYAMDEHGRDIMDEEPDPIFGTVKKRLYAGYEKPEVSGQQGTYLTTLLLPDVGNRKLYGGFTITKELVEKTAWDEEFIFQIEYKKENEVTEVFYGTVVVEADTKKNSIVFSGLPYGDYTITELNTNWRYELTVESQRSRDILLESPDYGEVLFKNRKEEDHWLSGKTSVTNEMTEPKTQASETE